MRTRRRSKAGSIGAVVLVLWLVIGALAAFQRGYFTSGDTGCAGASTVVVTVLAGPLNYLGANPRMQCPQLPQPSQ